MKIRNKTSFSRELDVDSSTVVVEPGETVDVPDELASGTPPTGEEGTPEFRAGTSGLLAQTDVWEKDGRQAKSTPDTGEED